MSGKRTYRKPELSEVKLRPREAVLQFCKDGPGTPEDPLCARWNVWGWYIPNLEFGT